MRLTNKLSPIIVYFDAIFTFGTISIDINAKIITSESTRRSWGILYFIIRSCFGIPRKITARVCLDRGK